METPINTSLFGDRAIEALSNFPLPRQGNTATQNYERILNWLYSGKPKQHPAALIIDISCACHDHPKYGHVIAAGCEQHD